MSLRWTVYVAPKPPNGAWSRKVSELQTRICDNFATVRDSMSVTINH